MRKIFLCLFFILSINYTFIPSSYADQQGYYVGGQLGGGWVVFADGSYGRLIGGYSLNRYVSFEGGTTIMPKASGPGGFFSYDTASLYSLDSAAKINITAGRYSDLYIKAGPSLLYEKKDHHDKLQPAANGSIGIDIKFTKKFSIDASISTLVGSGGDGGFFAGLGLTYHFVNDT